jgi:hypothetical protein
LEEEDHIVKIRRGLCICNISQESLKFFRSELGVVLGFLRYGFLGTELGRGISPLLLCTIVTSMDASQMTIDVGRGDVSKWPFVLAAVL